MTYDAAMAMDANEETGSNLASIRVWIEQIGVGAVWTGGDAVLVNRRFAQIAERPADELTELSTLIDLVFGEAGDEEVGDEVAPPSGSTDGSDAPVTYATQIRRPDGRVVDVDVCVLGELWLVVERDVPDVSEKSPSELVDMFGAIIQQVPGVLYQYREWPDGRRAFPFVTEGVRDIFGVPADVVTRDADAAWRSIHVDDVEDVRDSVDSSRDRLAPWRTTFRAQHPELGIVRAHGEAMPQRLPDGSTLWHGYISDVTRHHQAVDALQASEVYLEGAQRAGRLGAFSFAIGEDRFDFTDASASMLELENGAGFADLLDHIDETGREDFERAWTNAVRGRSSLRQVVQQTIDGEHHWVDWRATLSDDKARLIGTVQNVDDQRRRQDRLRRLATIVEQSLSMVMLTDLEHQIVYVNRAFETETGYSYDEAVGRKADFQAVDDDGESPFDDVDATLSSGFVWSGTFENRRRDGSVYTERAVIRPLEDSAGNVTHYVKQAEDLTEQTELQDRLVFLSRSDRLTGVANRPYLMSRLVSAVEMARRHEDVLALLLIDVDGVGLVNDSLGQSIGDAVLAEVAGRLEASIRSQDLVARVGGDEFAVMIDRVQGVDDVATVVHKLQRVVSDEPIAVFGHQISTTISMGVALFPGDAHDAEELMRGADAALHEAKKRGSGEIEYFTEALTERLQERMAMVTHLKRAVANEELWLAYQPRVDMTSGRIVSLEALARWTSPELGDVSPGTFIPVAESFGLIGMIGAWVIRTAIGQQAAFMAGGLNPVPIAVNLSGKQVDGSDIVEYVARTLDTFGVAPELFEVEITESAVMSDIPGAIERVRGFRELGVTVSIDDFGTAYSSLGRLRQLAVHTLKIDKSFIPGIGVGHDRDVQGDSAVVLAIIGIAKALEMDLVSEGVETAEQRDFLVKHGCTIAQGFLYARPTDADTVGTWLREGTVLPLPEGPESGPDHPASR